MEINLWTGRAVLPPLVAPYKGGREEQDRFPIENVGNDRKQEE